MASTDRIAVRMTARSLPVARFALIVAVLAMPLTSMPASAASGFVTRVGMDLILDGRPFRFTGLNIYNANSDGWCGPEMRTGERLDDALSAIGPGHEVIRGWFFQGLAIDWGTGQRDWSAFDRTLATADAHGMKVIPTLTDQWGECGTHVLDAPENGVKPAQWYVDGYTRTQPGMLVSYRDWIGEVVTRYRDDPRVAFWQLINEAEIRYVDGGGSPLPCLPGNEPAEILKNWAADVSSLIRSIDPNHLVSLGTIGSGQCGASGDQYRSVHDIPTIDLCEFHDYGSPNVPIPGDQWNGLQVRIDQCDGLNKPIFVGEAGIIPNDIGGTLQARADAFAAKIAGQFAAGVRGFLAWAWSPASQGSTPDNYDIGAGDPALDALIGPIAFPTYVPPVDGVPALNGTRAGVAVPVKFSLGGDRGLGIFAEGSPLVRGMSCSSGGYLDGVEQTVQAGSSSLTYDEATGLYTYVWKTQKSWARSCKRLLLLFSDGSHQRADFSFTR